MAELMQAVLSWPTLLLAIVVFSLIPDALLRVLLLCYPAGHPRRAELIAELRIVRGTSVRSGLPNRYA
jgi:ABC-type antimicrobial peptide transport system permease subunit